MELKSIFQNNKGDKSNPTVKSSEEVSNLKFRSSLELGAGKQDGLDDAYEYLKQCKDQGANVLVSLYYRCDFYPNSPFLHKWLKSSDITTLDDLYVQVYGFPKDECFKRKAQTQAVLRQRDVDQGMEM